MATFLKIVSGLYLLFVWFTCFIALTQPFAYAGGPGGHILILLIGVVLSIPAAVLFAFGQIVGDVRVMKDHLRAMRAYYDPGWR
jgi:hypothetical protein